MEFRLIAEDPETGARAGELITDHGVIPTPIFMPVGTIGTVKAVDQAALKKEINAPIILGNTYHLYLKPGLEVMQQAGGLHGFMNWDRNILTDSGGFQVYSLAENRKITEDGVTFKSHIDGSRHHFTPENVMDIQRIIGADIVMAFDECTPYPCEYSYAKKSMDMTHRWLKRCVDRFDSTEPLYGHSQTLFPIVQGSTYKDLRRESAEIIASFEREGNAIGGLSVGEPEDQLYEHTQQVCDILPKNKPRYLMGVGTPVNLLECISLGVDMFDCVMPTRNARNGMLFTGKGTLNMRNGKWKDDFSPIDDDPVCGYDTYYTKAYLRHLMNTQEILGAIIASVHNLAFYLRIVREAREHIIAGDYKQWKEKMVKQLNIRL